MEQLKQHYEKAILGLAMLALVYVAYGVLTDNSEEAIAEQREAREPGHLKVKKEMPPMEMRGYHATLARLEKAETLNLSNPHNLFNPVQWRVTRQGTTLKVELGNEIGAGAIVLSETRPLYLKIEYRGTTGPAGNIRYRFAVTREAAETKKKRLRMTTTAQLNDSGSEINFFLRMMATISLPSGRAKLYFPPLQRPSGPQSACVRTNNQWITIRFRATVAYPSYLEGVLLLMI